MPGTSGSWSARDASGGAWESVKFHFASLGIDIGQADFTVAGIGDMSGDVFGNGMLLSGHIRLIAAFDHRHVFLDPDPDPLASLAERERLFDLPRSSWDDYDRGLISAGGGVWPRSAKSIPVSPQARAVLGLADGTAALSPDQVISAILAAPVDLLWNGGIGTYVKATGQVHADAGDRSNDAVRVDASQLRAKVVGEGGNLGLTLPEFSVLLAHTKIAAEQEVLASDVPDDPYLRRVLTSYFPAPLRAGLADRMLAHRLHREIITTVVINDMVDRSGITFAFRLNEETGASVPHITEAWLVAREVFDMVGFWKQLKDLDGKVDTSAQILALLEGRKLTERATRWLLNFRRPPFDISATIDFFAGGVLTVATGLPKLLAGLDQASFDERREVFASYGFPDVLADRVAAMVPAYSAFDIVDIASKTGRGVAETAEVYFDLADRLQITRLRDRITALPRDDRWNTMARGALRDDLYTAHAALARDVLTVTEPGTPEERLAAWVSRNESVVARATQTLVEIWESDAFTISTLSVAVRAVRTLVATSTLPALAAS